MNESTLSSFMQAGIWCVVQVTLLTAIALVALWPLAWLKRPVGSGPALSAIAMVGVLTLLSFAPIPEWWNVLSRRDIASGGGVEASDPVAENESAGQVTNSLQKTPLNKPAKTESSIDWSSVFAKAIETTRIEPESSSSIWSWRGVLLTVMIGSVLLGGISLVASLLGLWRLRRTSRGVVAGPLREQLDILQAQACCRRQIEIRESRLIGGPATFGHFWPVILVPPSWKSWTEAQLSAVLAHELAHIQRGDYLSHLFGQLCLAAHFYHPLMHALVSRLRLDQELAADALAARWAGPRESYLRALAEVALSLPPRGSGLAVRSFVPSRGAWVRRIEMLKSMRSEGLARPGWALVWLGLMGAAALAVSSVRGPRGAALAQESGGSKPSASSQQNSDYLTKYVPQSAEFVVAIRPGQILANPLGKLIGVFETERGPLAAAKAAGIDLAKFEQVVISGPLVQGQRPQGVVMVRYADDDKLRSLLPQNKPIGEVGGVALYEVDGFAWGAIDAKTLIVGSTVDVTKSLSSQRGAAILERKAWNSVKSSPIAVVVKSEAIRAAMKMGESPAVGMPLGKLHVEMKPILGLASPIWEDTDAFALQFDLDGDVKATIHTESATDVQAKDVANTASALATLARNFLRTQLENNKELAPAQIVLAELARDTLSTMKTTTQGGATQVGLTLADKGKVVAMLPAFVDSARRAAAQQESMNNMKQILLALHNYHDTFGHFPPAILYGPDGKTPHSWRVAILPFIEQDALYRQYKLDEPWDSENNKKVLAQVPRVFQIPSEMGKSTNTSYFAVAGVNTLINLGAKGAHMTTVTDGTSNTIAIVDAKKDVPWTKPEDVTIDTPAAMLGFEAETFNAGMGDGSVRAITKKIDPTMLKWLFIRDDGNVTTIP